MECVCQAAWVLASCFILPACLHMKKKKKKRKKERERESERDGI